MNIVFSHRDLRTSAALWCVVAGCFICTGCSHKWGSITLTLEAPEHAYAPFEGKPVEITGVAGGISRSHGREYYVFVGKYNAPWHLCKASPVLTVVLVIPVRQEAEDDRQLEIQGYAYGITGGPDLRLDASCAAKVSTSRKTCFVSFQGDLKAIQLFYVKSKEQERPVVVKYSEPRQWPTSGRLSGRVSIHLAQDVDSSAGDNLLHQYWLSIDGKGRLVLHAKPPADVER